jgi:hypothetical protein
MIRDRIALEKEKNDGGTWLRLLTGNHCSLD